MMREALCKQRETTGYYTPSLAQGLAQGCWQKQFRYLSVLHAEQHFTCFG